MKRAIAIILAATVLAFVIVLSANASTTTYVVINEIEQDPPGTDTGTEWVELYNPTANSVNIGGWTLSTTAGATVTRTIPSGTIIQANEYYLVTYGSQWLDNTGESVILRDSSSIEIDRTPSLSDNYNDDRNWQRYPNGQDTNSTADWKLRLSTKEASNGEPIPSPSPSASPSPLPSPTPSSSSPSPTPSSPTPSTSPSPSPSTFPSSPSPSPSPSSPPPPPPPPPVNVSRLPPAPETVLFVGIGATMIPAAIGFASSKFQISSTFKKNFIIQWVDALVQKLDKKKLPLGKVCFMTWTEMVCLAISILIITVVASYVESGGLAQFLQPSIFEILLYTFISVCIVKITKAVSDAYSAQTCAVQKRLRLWWIGGLTYVISGILMFPFSSPIITRYDEEIPPKTKALMSLSKTLMLLTLAVPFGIMANLSMPVLTTMGDAGLLTVLTTACYSFLPFPPLAGVTIWSYNKAICMTALISMFLILICFTLQVLPYWVYPEIGLFSSAMALFALGSLRHNLKKPQT